MHLVTCAINAVQNIDKCIRRCGLETDEIILEQLASSYAVLTEDEKELGVCLVDIGGGTSDIAIFTEGAIRHTGVIPIAGDQVTNDIAMALRTPTENADEVKIKYACALTQLANPDDTIKVPSVGDRPPESYPGNPWRKLSSLAMTSSLLWCRQNSSVAVLKICWPPCGLDRRDQQDGRGS